ncbi:MAG: hypothetical protein GX558_01190, partial [Clostridiales bacterium]|nr:hypothetical protein [Clostridiales bacterium]
LVAGMQAALHAGNLDLARESFSAWRAWEDFLLSKSDGYIVNYSYYGDWAGPEYACDPRPGGAQSAVTPGVFMSTGYSYYNCALLAKFADLLGDGEAAARYRELAGRIRQAMLDKWYDSKTGVVATGSQGCQAFALWLDILPEAGRAAAARVMRDDLVHSDYHFTTGNLCTRYLLTELTRFGYLDEAWTLFTREQYPSFGYMIQNEATTIWERLELKKDPGMNSHSHPMYAAADQWLYGCIAGVAPTAPGYRTVDIRPHLPSGLLSAQATVDTVKGPLTVRWVRQYGEARLLVDLPFGVEAAVTFAGQAHRVGSGLYTFSAPDDGDAIC